jgi:hypothetical protein
MYLTTLITGTVNPYTILDSLRLIVYVRRHLSLLSAVVHCVRYFPLRFCVITALNNEFPLTTFVSLTWLFISVSTYVFYFSTVSRLKPFLPK